MKVNAYMFNWFAIQLQVDSQGLGRAETLDLLFLLCTIWKE